ncbi:hypothetical protein TUM19329_24630 [Legionella antarctica]|uniref:Transposase n=1 Tax=Legionella antarctica TaxID=2708020 RepID=A0A6F8T7U4_9GAMM|nr:hypothetical protein [Legionella antarctica]BCA96102.1 hypothetical protein TUM19329_24630 [Legionella antarctica]
MNFSLDEKRVMIDPLAELTIREQCLLLDLPVSSYYYSAKPISVEDEALMGIRSVNYGLH